MQRRAFLLALAAAAVVPPAFAQGKPMKIGVIGSGRIGSTIGGLWVKAGHEVMFSDRDPEQVKRAIDGLGPRARAGSVPEAAAFGDAVLIAVPYAALPAIQQQVGAQLKGKVVIDPEQPGARRATATWRCRRAKRARAYRPRRCCPARASCAASMPGATRPWRAKRTARRRAWRCRSPPTMPAR